MSVDHYENFPVASVLCPAPLRAPIVAIYWFARTADDIADEGEARPEERLRQLARYRAELLDYCARSANPVGRLLLHLHGVAEPAALRQSDAICSALQLINFWQDLSVDTPRGRFDFDHLLLGTGYDIDLSRRPELANLVDDIALWSDRFVAPEGEADASLGRYPYLGRAFEFTEKVPGSAPHLANIHVFNNGAVPSLGPICNGITGLKYGVPRMVAALTKGLFLDDADRHYAELMAYDEVHFRADNLEK
ncbi:MAG: squalene/phytoene synthase family protein [Rhizobiales bacterium]|nr:squalene/phytoene synthase family protein [Hyphomicrobiales bacterium]